MVTKYVKSYGLENNFYFFLEWGQIPNPPNSVYPLMAPPL